MRAVWRLRFLFMRVLCWVMGLRPMRILFTRVPASIPTAVARQRSSSNSFETEYIFAAAGIRLGPI